MHFQFQGLGNLTRFSQESWYNCTENCLKLDVKILVFKLEKSLNPNIFLKKLHNQN